MNKKIVVRVIPMELKIQFHRGDIMENHDERGSEIAFLFSFLFLEFKNCNFLRR